VCINKANNLSCKLYRVDLLIYDYKKDVIIDWEIDRVKMKFPSAKVEALIVKIMPRKYDK